MPATIQHPALTSPMFELVKSLEFDIQIGEDSFSLRFELLGDTTDARHFRAHIWRLESYRIQPTFPQNQVPNEPKDETSDETIFVDTAPWLAQNHDSFYASSPDEALQIVLDDFQEFLTHTSGHD